MKSELIDSEQVIGFESAVYEIISSENYRMVALAYKRNKKKAMELLNKVSIRLKLERAYPGQAKDIVKFILKMRDKYNQYISIYDNEYIIMDTYRFCAKCFLYYVLYLLFSNISTIY